MSFSNSVTVWGTMSGRIPRLAATDRSKVVYCRCSSSIADDSPFARRSAKDSLNIAQPPGRKVVVRPVNRGPAKCCYLEAGSLAGVGIAVAADKAAVALHPHGLALVHGELSP